MIAGNIVLFFLLNKNFFQMIFRFEDINNDVFDIIYCLWNK